MKSAATLNVSPPSFKKISAFIDTCIIRKEIRNKPVNPITNFLPIDDVKALLKLLIRFGYLINSSVQKYLKYDLK